MATDETVRAGAIAYALRHRDQDGHIPKDVIREAGRRAGVVPRTIYKWLNDDADWTATRTPSIDREVIAPLLFEHRGVVEQVYRTLSGAGVELPSRRQFYRQVQRELPQHLAAARRGEKGLRDTQQYIRHESDHRNHIWQADHTQLDIHIRAPHPHTGTARPWLTAMIDTKARLCLGYGLSIGTSPNVEMIVATLAKAVRLREVPHGDRDVLIGGVPQYLRHDLGADWRSERLDQVLLGLGIEPRPTMGRSAWTNGKAERFFRTVNEQFCKPLPGYIMGQTTDKDGAQHYVGEPKDLLTLDEFLARFARWVEAYNGSRPHTSLQGRTPLEGWEDDDVNLVEPLPEAIRDAMLETSTTRRVQKTGVHFDGTYYQSANMPLVGTDVRIRYLPHERATIEIYVDGQWHCTAYPASRMPAHEQRALHTRRGTQTRHVRQAERTGKAAATHRAHSNHGDGDMPVAIGAPEANGGQNGPRTSRPVRRPSRSAVLDHYADLDTDAAIAELGETP